MERGDLGTREEHGRGRGVKPNRTELKKKKPFLYLNSNNLVNSFSVL